jgi:hypothetical protein
MTAQLLILLPLFYAFGAHVSVSERKLANTFLYIPIVFGAIPVCIMFPLTNLIT